MSALDMGSKEFGTRWIQAGEEAIVGLHEPTPSGRTSIESLAEVTLSRHRMRGAWSDNDRLVVMQILDSSERDRWVNGKTALMTWGWAGDFGSCLSLTYYLRGTPAHPQIGIARAVIDKGDSMLEHIGSEPFKVAVVHGKQLLRCDLVDFTTPEWTRDAFAAHLATVRDHEPAAYPDAECHFWEVLNCQTNLAEYFSANDRLSLGWIKALLSSRENRAACFRTRIRRPGNCEIP